MLYIDPEECIDCGACVPECPEEAIFALEDLPGKYTNWIKENEVKSAELPVIAEVKEPLKKTD